MPNPTPKEYKIMMGRTHIGGCVRYSPGYVVYGLTKYLNRRFIRSKPHGEWTRFTDLEDCLVGLIQNLDNFTMKIPSFYPKKRDTPSTANIRFVKIPCRSNWSKEIKDGTSPDY